MTLGLVISILALVLLAALIQYAERLLTGSSPPPLVWVVGAIAAAIVAFRRIARRR